MRQTSVLLRLVSTKNGMRRILKDIPRADDFIRKSVEAGTYLSPGEDRTNLRKKNRPYPIEYEILTLNPPLPSKPRIPMKDRKPLKVPAGDLVEKYLQREQQQQQQQGLPLHHNTHASLDEYYQKLLGIPSAPTSSSSSIMGQKSSQLNRAYAFAIKQYEVMRTQDLSEEESLEVVEQLLAQDSKEERLKSRQIQKDIREWRTENAEQDIAASEEQQEQQQQESLGSAKTDDDGSDDSVEDTLAATSVPSVFHEKHRTLKALSIWSKRLEAVPYQEWTIGATVALDHWIARSVLEISEETWDAILNGVPDESLKGIGQDILLTRQAMFPETIKGREEEEEPNDDEMTSDVEAEQESTEKSIDELLASLGALDEHKDGEEEGKGNAGKDSDFVWNQEGDDVDDDQLERLVNQLQEWRRRHHFETKYENWTADIKKEFNDWLEDYIVFFESGESAAQVDFAATREALLAPLPMDKAESDELWGSIRDTTEAEIFLASLSSTQPPNSDVAAFWQLTPDEQLRKLVRLGNLRPLLDEYTPEKERLAFMERHADKLLEGLELEHLVEDPDGPIEAKDIPAGISRKGIVDSQRFRLEKLPYGSDEYGTTKAQRAREIFRAWNAHKAGRARYEEALFQRGELGLRYGDPVEEG